MRALVFICRLTYSKRRTHVRTHEYNVFVNIGSDSNDNRDKVTIRHNMSSRRTITTIDTITQERVCEEKAKYAVLPGTTTFNGVSEHKHQIVYCRLYR